MLSGPIRPARLDDRHNGEPETGEVRNQGVMDIPAEQRPDARCLYLLDI
jgi:hypothetical protein